MKFRTFSDNNADFGFSKLIDEETNDSSSSNSRIMYSKCLVGLGGLNTSILPES
ncbi:MAG: hypothetical protein ACFFAU_07870 [Candidatus Hodarchaeota archaeon]